MATRGWGSGSPPRKSGPHSPAKGLTGPSAFLGAFAPPPPPPVDQVLAYAQWVGLDLSSRGDLTWIAEKGLAAPLPPHWEACGVTELDATPAHGVGDVYYYNDTTGESMWDHPLDEVFRALSRVYGEAEPVDKEVVMRVREAKHAYVHGLQMEAQALPAALLPRSTARPHLSTTSHYQPSPGADDGSSGPGTPRQDGNMLEKDGHVASVGVQADPDVAHKNEEAKVQRQTTDAQTGYDNMRTQGCDPMPVDCSIMTVPVTKSADTMTTAQTRSTTAGVNTTPGVQTLPAAYVSASSAGEAPQRPRHRSGSFGPPFGGKAGGVPPLSPSDSMLDVDELDKTQAGATSVVSAGALTRTIGNVDDDATTQGDHTLGLCEGGGPLAEALMREMVASFQTQLVDHRKEVQKDLQQDAAHQKHLETLLTGLRMKSPRRTFPAPLKTKLPAWRVPEPLQRVGWAGCYGLVFVVHITLCILVSMGLPALLNTELSSLLSSLSEYEDL